MNQQERAEFREWLREACDLEDEEIETLPSLVEIAEWGIDRECKRCAKAIEEGTK